MAIEGNSENKSLDFVRQFVANDIPAQAYKKAQELGWLMY